MRDESTAKGHTIKEAIQSYQSDRDQLKTKDPATCVREDSGLKKWVRGFGDCLLNFVISEQPAGQDQATRWPREAAQHFKSPA